MNYKSKRNLTEAITTIGLSIAYTVFALGNKAPNLIDLAAWAKTILIFIGALVLVSVIVQIVFHFIFSFSVAAEARKNNEEKLTERLVIASIKDDERDKQINQHAVYITSYIIGIAFVLSLVFLAFGGKPVISLHILLAGLIFTLLAHSILSVIAYEKGGLDG